MIRLIWSRDRSTLSAFENLIPALWRLRLQVQSISLSHAEEAEGMLLRGASARKEPSDGKQEHKTGWRGEERSAARWGDIQLCPRHEARNFTRMVASVTFFYRWRVCMGWVPGFGRLGALSPPVFWAVLLHRGSTDQKLEAASPGFLLCFTFKKKKDCCKVIVLGICSTRWNLAAWELISRVTFSF